MTSVLRIILVAAALLSSVSAQARGLRGVNCGGTISNTILYADGNLVIHSSWRNGWTALCNMNREPDICKTWASIATASNISGKQVIVQYLHDTMNCGDIPTYAASPKPNYFGIAK